MSTADEPTGNHVRLRLPAEPASVPLARRAVVGLAATAGATEDQLDAIRLASSEAITNAVVHAYRAPGGSVTVLASVTGDRLTITVDDEGVGYRIASPTPGLGWGLQIMDDLSQELVLREREGGGTEVRLGFRIGSPIEMGPPPLRPETVEIDRSAIEFRAERGPEPLAG